MNATKDSERREREQLSRQPYDTREGGGSKPKQEKPREPKYQLKYHNYTPLAISREKALMMVENADVLKWPRHTRYTPSKKFSNKYCRFHRERGHNTEKCFQLKNEIERLSVRTRRGEAGRGVEIEIPVLEDGQDPTHWKQCTNQRGPGKDALEPYTRTELKVEEEEAISFNNSDKSEENGEMNDPMVVKLDIANFTVHKVLVDSGSSADIILKIVLDKMGLENIRLEPVKTPLVGFGGSEVASLEMIELPVSMGDEPKRKTMMVKFLVVDTPFTYNVILGTPGLNLFRAVISTYHMKMKFPTDNGIGEVANDQREARRCYNLSLRKEPGQKRRRMGEDAEPRPYEAEHMKPSDDYKSVQLEPSKQGKQRDGPDRILRKNVDMFAWSPFDFTGIDPEVIVHILNVDPIARPVQQKKRSFGNDKNEIIWKEVDKLLKAGYVSEVQYTDWLSNVVLVPKSSGKWRMCIDFTDLNKACPKDPYPLPMIDVMVDSTARFEMFSMMDAYQGYHQIYMAEEDRDKTSFITEKGIYCYNMMPFSLKNARATYQRLEHPD
ncbi:UNVERIFIED_CONTAM: Retrovirus-related Pol polyprotein from transposon [Sesamum indicum]